MIYLLLLLFITLCIIGYYVVETYQMLESLFAVQVTPTCNKERVELQAL